MAEPDQAQQRLVRVAARALARHGLVHAYGHCSLRLDEGHFLVAPSKPLGLVAADEACSAVPIDVTLPDGLLPAVSTHPEIYRARPDIRAISRVPPPELITLGCVGRPTAA